MRILRWLAIALVYVVAVLVAVPVGIGVVARFSDGPIGPFPGGPLRAGALVTEPDVDWSFANAEIELQLVEPPGSRIVGVVVHEGELFAVCDLGFIARRSPVLPPMRRMYQLKRWHEHALRDGRVVLRIAGKRYERQAVLVTDAGLLATLRPIVEELAEQFFSAALLAVPTDPEHIWFFRMDPRPQTQAQHADR